MAAASTGSLQPSSVLAAASALAAAAAAGFTGGPASSSVIANQGKTAAGKPASNSLTGGTTGSSGAPGNLCSGDPGATQSAAVGAGATWQLQLEQHFAAGSGGSASGSGLHTATHVLQQHRSSGGGNDTSQSGIDCTPRSVAAAGSAASISTAAPMVLSGGSLTAGHNASGLGSAVVAQALVDGGSGSAMGTPRAMETDTPGGLLPPARVSAVGSAINMVAAAAGGGMQQQQQAPVALAAHQRHSSGGLDVLATGGMRSADQASLVATGTPVKSQPGGGAAAPVSAAGLDGKGISGNAVAAFLAHQKQQQQQPPYIVDASTWAAAQTEHKQLQEMGSGSFSQQQQAILMQQQLMMQQQMDMAVVGQGVGNNASNQRQQHQQQQLGSVLMDRMLPRLQH